ncbi:hypothetical protein OIU79_029946 [Salix purpurea]|uniref:Uncharacterized protein n=1 Tax=Salix purpurea TaxID=77065 RepID=A0A9Q0VK07_SALPP|nr:hypothetical protein OIU79_029946 [Salix purpurea]
MARNEDLQLIMRCTLPLLDMKHGGKLISARSPKYSWGNTPLDEARIGGNKDLIKLLEAARASQIADDMQRMKCSVSIPSMGSKREEKRWSCPLGSSNHRRTCQGSYGGNKIFRWLHII